MSKAAIITPEDAAKLRDWTAKLISTFNGMEDLGEPFLGMFKDLKQQYNAILEKLPLTDAVAAAQDANWNLSSFLSCLTSTQAMLTYMGTKLNEYRAKNSGADPKQIETAVAAAIDAKVTSGELVKKEMMTTLCSASKLEGVTEGEKKVRDELKVAEEKAKKITERKTLLTTNSLPLPKDDAALAGTDAEFELRRTTATSRVETLKGKQVALNSPLMLEIWNEEKEFQITLNAVTHLRTAPAAGKPAEPFNKPADGGPKKAGFFAL